MNTANSIFSSFPKTTVFAAANGFSGFRNYFEELFSAKRTGRLFILKGGPGTGKNRFMRTVSQAFRKEPYSVIEVLCSSDPKSLDGVRISNGKSSVGLLDGTAPHATDAAFPALVETYIDLGHNLKREKLLPHKNELFYLASEKKKAYRKAYQYLSFCGTIHRNITAEYIKDGSYSAVLSNGKTYGFNLEAGQNESGTLLFSAFSKLGYHTLGIENYPSEKRVLLTGTSYAKSLFLDGVRQALTERNLGAVRFSSPFCDGETEGYFFSSDSLFLSAVHTQTNGACESVELPDVYSTGIRDVISGYADMENEIRVRAAAALSSASDRHFEMEAIYSAAMDFSENEAAVEKTVREIENYFEE